MKEILGFKKQYYNNDSVCPNCGYELNIPVREIVPTWFNFQSYDLYTCSRCNLQWRVRVSGV